MKSKTEIKFLYRKNISIRIQKSSFPQTYFIIGGNTLKITIFFTDLREIPKDKIDK